MRIDRVAYAKLFNLGNYENERIELDAQLDVGDHYESALAELAGCVQLQGDHRAAERSQDKDAAYKEYGAKAQLERINADIDAAQARWAKALAFLKAQGVDTGGLEYNDDIPF